MLLGRSTAAKPWVGAAVTGLLLVMLPLLIGLAAGLGNPLILIFTVGMLTVPVLIAFPLSLLWTVAIGGMVVAGLVQLYFPQLQVVRWVFAGAAIALPMSVFLRTAFSARRASDQQKLPGVFWWAMAFIGLAAVATLLNWRGTGQAVFGLKGYFQMWGLMFGLAFLPFASGLFQRLPKAILAIALLQIPFAIHQFFYLVPKREGLGLYGIVPVDIVSGTFGGDLYGGGANAVLALFQIVVVGGLAALWRVKALGLNRFLLLMAALLVPLLLNESKVAVVYLMLVFAIVFRREILAHPAHFVASLTALVVMVTGLLFSYTYLSSDPQNKSIADLVTHTISDNVEQGKRYGLNELNRFTALTFWAEKHGVGDPLHTLFGHGLGESREETGALDLAHTLASTRYTSMGIGLTAASALLWETGVAGLAVVLGMFVSAFNLAGRLVRQCADLPRLGALFQGAQAGIAVLALSLFHKNFFVFQIAYQVFLILAFGYLIYAARHIVRLRKDYGGAAVPA